MCISSFHASHWFLCQPIKLYLFLHWFSVIMIKAKKLNFTILDLHFFFTLYCVLFAVTRKCGQPDYSNNVTRPTPSTCGTASFLGVKTTTCECSTDYCNNGQAMSSAGHAKLSTAMIVTTLVAGIMLKIGAWEIFGVKQFLPTNYGSFIINRLTVKWWIQLSEFFSFCLLSYWSSMVWYSYH